VSDGRAIIMTDDLIIRITHQEGAL